MKELFDTKILSNVEVAENIFRLVIDAPKLSEISRAGQFVQVKISDSFTLRRPLGIASARNGQIKIFFRVRGHGTKFLSTMNRGNSLSILGPLGNGFDTETNENILLIGGGMGLAPLLCAAEQLKKSAVFIGGKNFSEVIFWSEEFRSKVDKVFVATDDGSFGKKGFIIDYLAEVLSSDNYSAIYTCGPEIMMRGVAKIAEEKNIACKVSFERRMACGLGACLGCSVDTTEGRKKVCKDGPIFDSKKVFAD